MRTPANAVSSFFYYMWNTWGKEECQTVFGSMSSHFWTKWETLTQNGASGAAERFFSELSDGNRAQLVQRAIALYDGNEKNDESDLKKQNLRLGTATNSILKENYEHIKRIVASKGGLIKTQDDENDTIYALEYVSADCNQVEHFQVCGIRLVDDDLQIFTEPVGQTFRVIVHEEDLRNEENDDQWSSLMFSENILYAQTVINIAEFIYQYT